MDEVQELREELRCRELPWVDLTDVQKATLLLDVSVTVRRNQLRTHNILAAARAYMRFGTAAGTVGRGLLKLIELPFAPDPPFRFENLTREELGRRVAEITDWAGEELGRDDRPREVMHAMLDLRITGQQLRPYLDYEASE